MRLPVPVTRWAHQGHRGLVDELDRACRLVRDAGATGRAAPGVSAWSVRDHLEHLWRADQGIVRWLGRAAAGSAKDDGGGPSALGVVVLITGYTPRGRAQAPAITRPSGQPIDEVATGLEALRDEVRRLGGSIDGLAAARVTLRHPILGCLRPAEWLRFAWLHHRHHRRIIDDILASPVPPV